MKDEVDSAVSYLASLLEPRVTTSCVEAFKVNFRENLMVKFKDHWHVDCPMIGNAYRCISIDRSRADTLLIQSAYSASITRSELEDCLPVNLWLWIDPFIVTRKLHEHGSTVILYEDASKLDAVASTLLPAYGMSSQSTGSNSSSKSDIFVPSSTLHNDASQGGYHGQQMVGAYPQITDPLFQAALSQMAGFAPHMPHQLIFSPPTKRPIPIVAPSDFKNSEQRRLLPCSQSKSPYEFYKSSNLYDRGHSTLQLSGLSQYQQKSEKAIS